MGREIGMAWTFPFDARAFGGLRGEAFPLYANAALPDLWDFAVKHGSSARSPWLHCRVMATSQSRTIAALISDAAIVRITSNCSRSACVIANPSGRKLD
jgi:hypothetical protein